MFDKIITFSLENKFLVGIAVILLIISGVYSSTKIPLDAVPDITNNQVQVVTVSPTLAPQEVEQLVSYPIEATLTNIPDVLEVRSISRYGLSVVTIVFEDKVDIMRARQFVQEQLDVAKANMTAELGQPELMPITTGLGEIYQYTLTVEPAYAHLYDATKLRTIQDWIIKRQLNGTPGIIEVSSFGGYLKQYEVSVVPELLKASNLTIRDVISALEANNQNSGGSYIERGPNSFYIRTEGRVHNAEDIELIVISNSNGTPIKVRDVAKVSIGSAKRYGAMTMDGKGEVVGGITLMLKGANSSEVLENVTRRIEQIRTTLPEGLEIYPYLDRSKLINKTINTATNNLLEGGLIVIFVLLIILGNVRAGLIVASVIPLSMLFALSMMNLFGVSASLMSLGALDFGIVVDGAVIIIESLLHTLSLGYIGKRLTQSEMDNVVKNSTSKIYRSAAFGILIILIVFIPILTLQGIEGKTFRPMAQTVGFAIFGSLLLSVTYIPVMSSLFLSKKIGSKINIADKINRAFQKLYKPILRTSLRFPRIVIILSFLCFVMSIFVLANRGSEFIPTLEEGDIAMQQTIKPGSSLQESIRSSTKAEAILLKNFPEVLHVVSKIGTAEVPTDPMAIEDADIMIILKDKSQWTSAKNREELVSKMKKALEPINWASYEFTQPIQLRFNELMTGSKSDIAIKIFGEDVERLTEEANKVEELIKDIEGVGDIRVDQTDGLRQLKVQFNRNRIAQYGLNIEELNQVIRSAFAGEVVGQIFEEERKFDLVVRLAKEYRQNLDLSMLNIASSKGNLIPLSEVAQVIEEEGPALISREQARRYINIGVNVRNQDIASLVTDIESTLNNELQLPAGYEIQYGGQFENLQNARKRLLVAVPIALLLIFIMLYLAFSSVKDSLIIFMAVPMSAIGGILALFVRDMPFSISSGVGFIALFGVAVLNGIVLISQIKQSDNSEFNNLKEMISVASLTRLRPVLMTATVAALGFLPMALSTGSGAEVQKPLATVVIGGLITSTMLTLIALPAIYFLFYKRNWKKMKALSIIVLVIFGINSMDAQQLFDLSQARIHAVEHHPLVISSSLNVEKEKLALNFIGQIDPLSIIYEVGQINESNVDHHLQISQDLSFLFGKKQNKNLVNANVEMLRNQVSLQKSQLIRDIDLEYANIQYLASMIKNYENIDLLYAQLEPSLQAKYEFGEIDIIALQSLSNELLRVRNEKAMLQAQFNEATQMFKLIAYLPQDSKVLVDTLYLYQNTFSLERDEHPLIRHIELNKTSIDKQQILNRYYAKLPRFSIGYFAQSLSKDLLFQGGQVNLALPLDQRTTKTKNQQLEVEKQLLENQKLYTEYTLDLRINELRNKQELYTDMIANFRNNFLSKKYDQIERIRKQLELGEIDFLRFSQLVSMIYNTERDYFRILKEYNQNIARIKYLTHNE